MKRIVTLILPVFALCWVPAHAETILYSDSGTFSASTPSDAFGFSGPSEAWAFSFEADSHPVVSNVGMGGFNFAFSDFSYSLGGSPVAITPTFIRFFSAGNGGGFEICFNGMTVGTCTDDLGTGFSTLQMYAGPTSAPTLLPRPFNLDVFSVVVNGAGFNLPNTTVDATAVPEPSTLLTLAAGLLILGGRRLYWRR